MHHTGGWGEVVVFVRPFFLKKFENWRRNQPEIMRILLLLLCGTVASAQTHRWDLTDRHTIRWDVTHEDRLPHADNVEMAGRRVAAIVGYAIDTARRVTVTRDVIFPQLHPYLRADDPAWKVYRAYFRHEFSDADFLPKMYVGERQLVPGPVRAVRLNGLLHIEHDPAASGIAITRTFYPAPREATFLEQWTLTNTTDQTIEVEFAPHSALIGAKGEQGLLSMIVQTDEADVSRRLKPNVPERVSFRVDALTPGVVDFSRTPAAQHRAEREAFLAEMRCNLILETPDSMLNALFEFSKVRASESIFDSQLGLIHSPGGGRYYVGIWANDQAEYISPFFPYLGYAPGNESADNTYRAFATETTADYQKIRYSFEVENLHPPAALDRGDAAMIAYGATQYVLARGDRPTALEHWPLIEWCLEYNHRMRNAAGVVRSESDEMEGRIETGDANLSTSALYYGALRHAADLATELGKKKAARQYRQRATDLARAIEQYFGATIQGLNTYKYFDEHRTLRHWIALPLVVGIFDRADATIPALFDRLWTDAGGVYVERDHPNPDMSQTFWDRGTLYALRGTFLAGATDRSLQKLRAFSEQRLLGERVPYVVEAFPEGAMAHLSAESGLYCRVFTEGLFGLRPVGFGAFECRPVLPTGWDRMALRNVRLFGKNFDLETERTTNGQWVRVRDADGNLVTEQALTDGVVTVRF